VGAEQPGQQTGEHQMPSKEAAAAEEFVDSASADKVRLGPLTCQRYWLPLLEKRGLTSGSNRVRTSLVTLP
jgi:hypothetical protein